MHWVDFRCAFCCLMGGIATKKILCFILSLLMMTAVGCSTQASTSGTESIKRIKQPEPFIHIDMATISSGYAMTKNFHVLKTVDSGANWTDTLKINSHFSYSDEPALCVISDNVVYVASYTASGIEIQKSTDAGKSWSKNTIKMQVDDFNSGYGGSLALSFINQSDGFLLTSGLPAAGLMNKALYRTSDGGNNWAYIGKSENPEQGAGDLAGINGYTTGVAFFNSGTGYITCTYHSQKEISVYKTGNSGKSWSAVAIPLPKKYASSVYDKEYYADAYQPAVYGKDRQNAKMELYFCHDEVRYPYIYSSDNGGTTWYIDGISNLLMKKYCFVDNKNGFGLDESGRLYTTNNGGISWLETL